MDSWRYYFVAVLLVIIVLYLFFKSESMSGQISEFDKAVNDKDYNKLTEIVGSGEKVLVWQTQSTL